MQGSSEPSGSGVRIELRLESENPERVVYRLRLSSGPKAWSGHAALTLDAGAVELAGFERGSSEADSEPPEWVLSATRALLRSIWRARAAEPAWPRRIRRWRAPPAHKLDSV